MRVRVLAVAALLLPVVTAAEWARSYLPEYSTLRPDEFFSWAASAVVAVEPGGLKPDLPAVPIDTMRLPCPARRRL
jgi:hypothetical protein